MSRLSRLRTSECRKDSDSLGLSQSADSVTDTGSLSDTGSLAIQALATMASESLMKGLLKAHHELTMMQH